MCLIEEKSKEMSQEKERPLTEEKPYIPSSKTLPEITVKSLTLGIFLAVILAASNAYLGLKIGQTVSACIPAAVISMSLLRFFKNSNILENNLVQTIASAGEVIAAGIIFTLPALVLMGFWKGFPYLETTAIAAIGGVLGVVFSIPLRRALIVDARLTFPEGVATAEVLKAGDAAKKNKTDGKTDSSAKLLVTGGIIAAFIKVLQSGFQVIGEEVTGWFKAGSSIFGFGTGLSPVIIAAGYIVGIRIGICLFIGAFLTWFVALPIVSGIYGLPEADSIGSAAMSIWSTKLRYIGVGTMIVGGIWALVSLMKPITKSIKTSFQALKDARDGLSEKIQRTEHDIPMTWIIGCTVVLSIPIGILFAYVIDANNMPVTSFLFWSTTAFVTLFSLIAGFICSSIAGYMAGIVGSSSNPLSGVAIAAILAVSLVLLSLLSTQVDFSVNTDDALSAAAISVIIAAIVATAAAVGSDNLQDLKAGHVVGSTPWKQEAMLIVGAIAGAVAIAPILSLLYEAYGIGGSFPREGMDPSQTLSAPQATLMASVAKGVFLGGLPWNFIITGMVIGIIIIIINSTLKSSGSSWQFPVLAVALGLYLPVDITIAFFVGTVLKEIATRSLYKKKKAGKITSTEVEKADRRGMLFASGAIAGESLMGVALSIPFALYQTTNVFAINLGVSSAITTLAGVIVIIAFLHYFFKIATKAH